MANKQKNSTWDNMIKPVVVLFTICLVVSGLLAVTNNITAPIIAENALKAEQAALLELLPDATSFTEVEGVEMENVNKVYSSDNNVGYVITSAAKGYGGDIEWMTAFDTEGTIVGAKVLSQSETAGLGAKVEEDWFQAQFKGHNDELTPDNIDMISGATISSKATIKALNAARKAFNQYALGVVEDDAPAVTVTGNDYSTVSEGFGGDMTVTVTIEDGKITAVNVNGDSNENTSPAGDAITPVTERIVRNNSADVDGLAGATITSDGIKNAVKTILSAYADGSAKVELAGGVRGEATGFGGDTLAVVVSFNDDGTINEIVVEKGDMEDTSPAGEVLPKLIEEAKRANSADIDGVAGATFTSDGFKRALAAAIASK